MNLNAKFLDPESVLKEVEIKPGISVADFGCGSGYFSLALAQKVGQDGKVFALDVLPQSLESVESRAKLKGITNIIAKRVNLENEEGSDLPKESLDLVIMKDVLFQNGNKKAILKEAFRVLKPGGQAVIVEWNDGEYSIGPDKKLRISMEDLKKEVQEQNFLIEKTFSAGDFHYGIVAGK